LNEAVYILKRYIKKTFRPVNSQLAPIVSALNDYVEVVMEVSGAVPKDHDFDRIELNDLKSKGLLRNDLKVEEPDDMMKKRRSVLRALVKEDGWDWTDVAS